jgi:hypothetical protein
MILKTLTIVAALLAGGTSLATAQNGLPTGGQPPVAGGANGGSWGGGWYGSGWYGGAPVYGYDYGYRYGYAPYRPLYGVTKKTRHLRLRRGPLLVRRMIDAALSGVPPSWKNTN